MNVSSEDGSLDVKGDCTEYQVSFSNDEPDITPEHKSLIYQLVT